MLPEAPARASPKMPAELDSASGPDGRRAADGGF
jgi:hypothetical protein